MNPQISASVGLNGKNVSADVLTVQRLLAIHGVNPGPADGVCGPRTINAIKTYQGGFLHQADGRVDLGGRTWKNLCADSHSLQPIRLTNASNTTQPVVTTPTVRPTIAAPRTATRVVAWDKTRAVNALNTNAQSNSLGRCAYYVRIAVEAGGVTLVRHVSAKDYGSSLVAVGFSAVNTSEYQAGDVAIIQPIPGHPHGHATMYNGSQWISDFRQNNGLYPGSSYRKIKPSYAIYRHP
jgi:peptidoglycan hydrolase-like protein with peptidoglycan-binding domain